MVRLMRWDERIALERFECPAQCGFYGRMDIELTSWGARMRCSRCGASFDVNRPERTPAIAERRV